MKMKMFQNLIVILKILNLSESYFDLFVQHTDSSIQQVLSTLLSSADLPAAFPNLAKLAAILIVLPVTTATVERTFSSMKLIETSLQSRMGENTLEHAMHICIEGPDQLPNDTKEADRSLQTCRGENLHFELYNSKYN